MRMTRKKSQKYSKSNKEAKKTSYDDKQAPSKVPKNNISKAILAVFLMLAWVGVAVIASQLVVGYVMVWILGPQKFNEPAPTAVYSALSYILALVLIIFIPPLLTRKWAKSTKESGEAQAKSQKWLGTDREEMGVKGWPTWADIGLAPVGFIIALVLAAGFMALFSLFPWFDAEQVQEVGFSYYIFGSDRIIAFLTLVVIAPIAEELIFRGWLYGKMRAKLSTVTSNAASMVISAFLVSLLFGIVHLQWNVGVNVFAMSLVLCAMREITGTIYSGILMHMIKNGVAFYLLYVLGIG